MQLLFLQEWFSGEVVKAIGWTLIHSLWQGLLAAVLAGIIIISTRKTAARIRYNLLGFVLVLFIITTGITFSRQLNDSVIAGKTPGGRSIAGTDISFVTISYETASPSAVTSLEKFVAYFNTNADLFVLVWAIFFLFHCIKLATGLAGIQRLRNYKTHQPPEEWLKKMDQLCKLLNIKQTSRLLQSGLVKVPVAIGFFKPVILVPLGLLSNLPPEQVETILLHELAHIRRKDYLVNILQRFTEAVFFFNPALLWISSLVRQEREACCDDIVVANTAHKGSYLEALVSFHEYSFASSRYAVAINSKKHYLLNRVKRMITRENQKLDSMEKIVLIFGLVALTAFTFIPKKDTTSKKNITTTSNLKELRSIQAKPAVLAEPPQPRKTLVKKENKRPLPEVSRTILPTDTVPSSKKEKTTYSDLKFPSVSSTVNDDGNTRTETTTVTDQDGKKYTYTKLNNKITSLSIDGKTIPESEISNYLPLFEQIEMTVRENKARRLLDMERRKADRAEKSEDRRNIIAEKRLLREYQSAQKQYLLQQNRQSKLVERSGRALEDQRKETRKLLEKLKERRMNAPMINGREVIKNTIPIDKPNTADVNVKAAINKETAIVLQKIKDIKLSVEKKDIVLKKSPEIALKFDVSTHIENIKLKDFDHNPRIEELKLYQHEKVDPARPDFPVKKVLDVKPSSKAMPVKPKTNTLTSRKRVTA